MRTRLRVYVAGPYTSKNEYGVLMNIKRGIAVCADLIKLGFAPYCPWLDYQYVFSHGTSAEELFDVGQAWLDGSDAIFMSEGWEDSIGSNKELEYAKQIELPMFVDREALIDWKRSVENV